MPRGRVITFAGNATDENSFEEPDKLKPVTSTFNGFTQNFSYEFAPMSFTILRFRVAVEDYTSTKMGG